MRALERAWASVKALSAMRWSRTAAWFSMLLGSTTFDYRASAGDGRTNAAVMACVRWAQRALPEAPLTVMLRTRDGELQPSPEHALQQRLESPNPYYSGLHLIGAIVADLMLTGNAYVIKVRSGQRRVVELWWVPSTLIEPMWPDNDPSVFISHYEYRVEGQVITVAPADVVHIRQGFDPQNVRKGLSDLASLYREIATDNEAANWSGSLLRNGAVPGVVISPEGDSSATPEDLEEVKTKFQQRFGGDQRGAPLVMKGPTKVQVLSFTPEQMDLGSLRRIPEERITAVLGIPAAVVGLGAGLENTKVGATMREMREQAYESCLIPIQRLIVAELQMQLVPDFGDPSTLRVQFDLSQVRVLQDDQNALHERARADLVGGLLTLNQALGMIGEEPLTGPEGDVRYLPTTITVTPPDALIPESPAIDDVTPPDEQPMLPPGKAFRMKVAGTDALVDRYEAALTPLEADATADLFDAFEAIADSVIGRLAGVMTSSRANGHANGHAVGVLDAKVNEAIAGLVTTPDHAEIRSLLRSYILKSARSAAEALAPLTGGTPVRIQRNNPRIKAAMQAMEDRLVGMVETTGEDVGRLVRRLERRPGSVSLAEVQEAILTYVKDTYPGRAAAIARTELGYGHAAGVLTVVEKAGLGTQVHVYDGDGDSACQARNGTVVGVEEAQGIGLLHPNCRLRLIPIISASEAAA